MANAVGALPDGYVNAERVGEGAEGGAWSAIEVGSGQRVVLKRVPPSGRDQVRRAFETLRRIGSPHLPAPRALLEDGTGATWIVTGWVEGRPLRPGPAALPTVLEEIEGLARALAALHAAGAHHGDVSPANVVAAEGNRVALIDLGTLGRLGTGTPGFIAPEALAGGGGPVGDVFAMACILCWRLFGRVPWPRPEGLVRVRDATGVKAALEALEAEGEPLDARLRELLVRALDPRVARRPDATEVADRLAQLRQSSAGPGRGGGWAVPSRLAYQGVPVADAVRRLAAGEARVVAVVGASGVGRGRVVEEIVQALQARGTSARLCEPARLPRVLSVTAVSWFDAWLSASTREGVLGLVEEPSWPSTLASGPHGARAVAALLAGATALASTPLVVPVTPEVAVHLADDAAVVQVVVRPWSTAEIKNVVAAFGEPAGSTTAWTRALHAVTGGWPGSVVRGLQACAAANVATPSPAAVEAALAGQASMRGVSSMAPELARAVLRARWSKDADLGDLPSHLHDGRHVLGAAVASARAALGRERVRELAVGTLGTADSSASLELALDADDRDAIVAALSRDGVPHASEPAAEALLDWARRATSRPSTVSAAAAKVLLARADAAAALSMVEADPDPRCRLEAARALQRTGQLERALEVLAEAVKSTDDRDLQASLRGLRWRLLVDRGEAARARAEAQAHGDDTTKGPGSATAQLWAGYAAMVGGDTEVARRRLDRAFSAIADRDDAEAAAVRARVEQLQGNIAQIGGDLPAAARSFDDAARSFDRASEPVGSLTLRGSVAALAVPMAAVQTGLVHGRASLRGLLASGQVAALPESVVNLVQLLMRAGAEDEARTTLRTVERLLTEVGERPALANARLARAHADIEAGALVTLPRSAPATTRRDLQVQVERQFVAVARKLDALESYREAADGWLRAALLARVSGRLSAARSHLAAARADAERADDSTAVMASRIESVALAAAAGDAQRLQTELKDLETVCDVDGLRRDGLLELNWAYDRAVMAAVRCVLPPDDPRRAQAAARALSTLEAIMKKTSNLDAPSVRASVVGEGGDPSVLEGLLEDLSSAGVARAAPASAPGEDPSQARRLERLLRMYRRFAREERLEPLLEQIVDAMMDLTDAERGAVVVARSEGEPLVVTRELAADSEGFKFSRSVIDRVMQNCEPVLSVDAAADERFDESRSISHLNLRSVLAVPLQFRGKLLGAAYVDHRLRRGNFDEDDLAHTEAFADLAALAVAHAAALAEVREQAQRLAHQGVELQRLLEAREVEMVGLREAVRTQAPASGNGRHGIIGNSAKMQRVFKLIDRLGDADVPVVIHGESGTGKELVARAIHDSGPRRGQAFVAENCGAIPETLLESVLFGHAKGSFTGAQQHKPGLFEAADGGTIFLDEVGEMSPAMQTKLLRVLQEGEVRRVGENKPRKVDVRVIAASNRDLDAMVEKGQFRQDLYYRINVVRLDLPPLRERTEDITSLVEHFCARHAPGRELAVSPHAMRVLSAYRWPGNVRELENEVQRWVALSEGTVEVADLSPAIVGRHDAPVLEPDDLRIRPRVDRLERDLIARALEQTGGNQTQTAKLLGLSRYGLQKKLRRLEEEGVTFE